MTGCAFRYIMGNRRKAILKMNTQRNPKLVISARHLGPILSLDGYLSEKCQNLVFARNGMGKSFLSRGFRFLDLERNGGNADYAVEALVSEESTDGKASLTISRGSETLGKLSIPIGKEDKGNASETSNRIFHVFSDDFVQEELRERQFVPDENIENEITVDIENIKLKKAVKALDLAKREEFERTSQLKRVFDEAVKLEVLGRAKVRRNLDKFGDLVLEEVLLRHSKMPSPPAQSLEKILKDLVSLNSIPVELADPETVEPIQINDIEFEEIKRSLQRLTSPSTVAEDLKIKIEKHRSFIEAGKKIVEHNADTCPFCGQSTKEPIAASTIRAYMEYFKDEEALHKKQLSYFSEALDGMKVEIDRLFQRISTQQNRFDRLKSYVSSQRAEQLEDFEAETKQALEIIARYKGEIEAKRKAIDQEATSPTGDLDGFAQKLVAVIQRNNKKVEVLRSIREATGEERKELQREVCRVFEADFVREHWSEIENIAKAGSDVKAKSDTLDALERSNPRTGAKERVANTFEFLLGRFFGEKYVFDRKEFILKRGKSKMFRGVHRTLSDGEKTAIAFCYFIACIHRKVESNGDYRNLFLVFDDPVTSMSYDYVFTIAQTLKNISISTVGEISLNPRDFQNRAFVRPEIIILTHSSYFFNIAVTGRVVKDGAAFVLCPGDGNHHKLTGVDTYRAPFQHQIREIYDIAKNGMKPDHQTGNAVRSVLEAVGRFCYPNRIDSLTEFINFISEMEDFNIPIMMINHLSHGTYGDETPSPDDLKLACEETIEVVKKFARGQIEIVQGVVDD